ncbi:hypothetical protein ACIQCF_04470 [Streptomyces sp. NPDC088353]|uniref:hypothetical protein n=1 Tax=Streptomyces sp. NPDC088353 TaxID=3365855 RepID=UPI00381F3E7E
MTFSPKTWIVGEVVSAALLNQEIRDQWNSVLGAWTTYTPTWTAATTNPALGNGTLTGRYMKIGRTVLVQITLTMGSTTTYGSGTYNFSLPVDRAGLDAMGTARLSTTGSAYLGQTLAGSGITVSFPSQSTPGTAVNMSSTAPATLAATHVLRMNIAYEAVS